MHIMTRTLDEVAVGAQQDRLALVKLDLEGAEHAVLIGPGAILEHGRADFLLELEPEHRARQGASGHEVVDLMRRTRLRVLSCGMGPPGPSGTSP